MGGSRGEGKSSFEPTPSRGEGKSSGSQYPLRPSSGIGGGGGKDSDSDSDSDGGPPGRPSRPGSRPQSLADHNSAGSKDTNDGPTIKMSRSKVSVPVHSCVIAVVLDGGGGGCGNHQ